MGGTPGSEFVLGKRIWFQEQRNLIKINKFTAFHNYFCAYVDMFRNYFYLRRYFLWPITNINPNRTAKDENDLIVSKGLLL